MNTEQNGVNDVEVALPQNLEDAQPKEKNVQTKSENAYFADNRRKQELEKVTKHLDELEKQLMEKQSDENASKKPEDVNFYKIKVFEQIIKSDLSKIKEKYPDVEDFGDIPKGYLEIMATGIVKDPVTVYELLTPKKQTPPSSGSVKNTQPLEKDFYTSDEVDLLSDKELNNPKILDKVLKSMTKW